jgi:hypothetical protein
VANAAGTMFVSLKEPEILSFKRIVLSMIVALICRSRLSLKKRFARLIYSFVIDPRVGVLAFRRGKAANHLQRASHPDLHIGRRVRVRAHVGGAGAAVVVRGVSEAR